MRAEVKASAEQKIREWTDLAKGCCNPLIAAQLQERADGGEEILNDIEKAETRRVPNPRYSPAPPPPDTPFRSA